MTQVNTVFLEQLLQAQININDNLMYAAILGLAFGAAFGYLLTKYQSSKS